MTFEGLIINELLQMLSQDYASRKFVPILETDVVGYLYYLWISKFGDARKVHLDKFWFSYARALSTIFHFINYKIGISSSIALE
jgi:hypothetical protein